MKKEPQIDLTEEKVLKIAQLYLEGSSYKEIATTLNIYNPIIVKNIINGKNYKKLQEKVQNIIAPREKIQELKLPKDQKKCSLCLEIFPKNEKYFHKSRKSVYDSRCKKCKKTHATYVYKDKKMKILKYYSKNIPECMCCYEKTIEFLTLDHIYGGGSSHRKELKNKNIFAWIIENNFPPGFQILCMNCNFAKGIYGKCPHQQCGH